ncbi:MAG: MlaD family protein [Oligoflexales bacterium]
MRKLNLRFSPVWLFPVGVAVITAILYFNSTRKKGIEVTISFAQAGKIEPEVTPLRYRGVEVGTVSAVELSRDIKSVIVKARLERFADRLAVSGTKFTIVTPKIGVDGVKGLDTLVSGAYIDIEPGDGLPMTQFSGATFEDSSMNVTIYHLRTRQAQSVDVGDSVTFRGLKVGEVIEADVSDDFEWVDLKIGIDKKFAKLVRVNSHFWVPEAVSADIGFFSAKLKVSSFEEAVKGSVAFSTPKPMGKIAAQGKTFVLSVSQ